MSVEALTDEEDFVFEKFKKPVNITKDAIILEDKNDLQVEQFIPCHSKTPKHQVIKYPKYVFLIVLNQFCERFAYFGIRTVLFIFLTSKFFISKSWDILMLY